MLRTLKRTFAIIVLVLAALSVLLYASDYVVFRSRVVMNQNPYGSVTVQRYYAVQQKNGKTEFLFDPSQPQTCVRALFPHGGYAPCWYLSRHPEQRTDI